MALAAGIWCGCPAAQYYNTERAWECVCRVVWHDAGTYHVFLVRVGDRHGIVPFLHVGGGHWGDWKDNGSVSVGVRNVCHVGIGRSDRGFEVVGRHTRRFAVVEVVEIVEMIAERGGGRQQRRTAGRRWVVGGRDSC